MIHHDAIPSTIARDLIQTLGISYEQNRPDRDEHVLINYDNIHKSKSINTLLSLVILKK